MRLQVPARGVTLALALAGCLGPFVSEPDERGVGWIVFDSADDGCECAQTVRRTRGWNASFEGASAMGHEAFYEAPVPAGVPLVLTFATPEQGAHVRVRLELRYAVPVLGRELRCEDDGRAIVAEEDERYVARVEGAPGSCTFALTFEEAPEAENGIHLAWSAWTAGPEAADGSNAAGLPLRFEARAS